MLETARHGADRHRAPARRLHAMAALPPTSKTSTRLTTCSRRKQLSDANRAPLPPHGRKAAIRSSLHPRAYTKGNKHSKLIRGPFICSPHLPRPRHPKRLTDDARPLCSTVERGSGQAPSGRAIISQPAWRGFGVGQGRGWGQSACRMRRRLTGTAITRSNRAWLGLGRGLEVRVQG